MEEKNGVILSVDEEERLLAPIDEYIGSIQQKVNALRVDGTDKVVSLTTHMAVVKENANYTKAEKAKILAEDRTKLEKAKAVEAANKAEIKALISDATAYLDAHYDKDYYDRVVASCAAETAEENARYSAELETLKQEHEAELKKLNDPELIKDEKYVYKNRQFDAKLKHGSTLQQIKDRQHNAFTHRYHLLDQLRLSKFTAAEKRKQKWESNRYTFNMRQFLLKNGLYIVILFIFILLCILCPIVKGMPLLTMNNILNILQAASPRMFLALGVGGLILLAGTDLSVGRMVGTSMVLATMIMHKGVNTTFLTSPPFPSGCAWCWRWWCAALSRPPSLRSPAFLPPALRFTLHLYHGEHADHVRPHDFRDQRRLLRCDRDEDPEDDHPQDRQIPDHYSVGRGRHRHHVLCLEQNQARQVHVRSGRQPRSRGGLRHFGL